MMPNNQGGGFKRNSSSSTCQKPSFQVAYSAPKGHPSQPHVAQSYLPPNCND